MARIIAWLLLRTQWQVLIRREKKGLTVRKIISRRIWSSSRKFVETATLYVAWRTPVLLETLVSGTKQTDMLTER